MRQVHFTLVLFVIFQAPMFSVNRWTAAIEKLERSVMQISDKCSALSINDDKDYALTAKHCVSEDPAKLTVVDGVPSTLVFVDVHKDLAVLHVPGLDRPAMVLASHNPAKGDDVASLGFGGGYERDMFRTAVVSQPKAIIPDAGPGEWVLIDAAFVGGQSGAPVVNERGEVVMIVQMSNAVMGLGRGAETIEDRTGKYWQKPKP